MSCGADARRPWSTLTEGRTSEVRAILEVASQALQTLLQLQHLGMLVTGVLVGLTIGILPGLGGLVGMSLLLPFVYGMDPVSGIALLLGMAAVVATSDTFPSVLMGIPGSAGSQATIMDGYPLAKNGQATRALSAAFIASLFGGLIGALALSLVIPVARPLVLALGSPELLMLSLVGLSTVGVLSSNAPLKGLMAALLGLVLGAVGGAPATMYYRYWFDQIYLMDGIPLVVLALGLFALPEIVDILVRGGSIAYKPASAKAAWLGWLQGLKDAYRYRLLILRHSLLGVFVGFIPGLGGSVADWINYGVVVQTSKDKSQFGKGDIRGVIAPESANNAKEGGALIPTLLFGIPGSGSMAILLAGLLLMGVQPGPALFRDNLHFVYVGVWSLALASVLGVAICFVLSRWIASLASIRFAILAPFVLGVVVIGAFQATRHWGDFLVLIGAGILGWFMKRFGWSRPALLVGFVLAFSVEQYLWISISRYGAEWLTRPGVLIIAVLAVVVMLGGSRIRTRPGVIGRDADDV